MLLSTGVLQQTLLSGDSKDDNLYCLSDLGIKLCLYGLHEKVNVENSHGTSIPVASNDEIQQMINDELSEKPLDDDEAQFEYDRLRGK